MRFEAVLGRDAERSVNLVDNVKKITRTTCHAKRERAKIGRRFQFHYVYLIRFGKFVKWIHIALHH